MQATLFIPFTFAKIFNKMRYFTILLATLFFHSGLYSQAPIWRPLIKESVSLQPSWNSIKSFSKVNIDFENLKNYLKQSIPAENNQGKTKSLDLPLPDGTVRRFQIMQSPVMEPEISSKYPEIKTFKGSDGLNYTRIICTDKTLKAYIISDKGDIIIEALNASNPNEYGVYFGTDINIPDHDISAICGERGHNILKSIIPKDSWGNQNVAQSILTPNPVTLITYKIAISCTGEFGQSPTLGGGTTASVIAKMADALTYANAVYEKDFAIHFNMVNNNDRIVFLDPDTDPFDNTGSGGYLLGQNTSVINPRIGPFLYDVGHVFNNSCTDVGGIANLGVVCNRESKANGVTCWYTSEVAYVAQRIFCHEMGHQFSASHTFSNCNGNESGTMYEPGGGTSIMSYQGLCGALNLESGAPPHPNFFHSCSLEQIIGFTRNYITCGTKSDPLNNYPESKVLTAQNLVLPIRTPFELKGFGFDMEDTSLTYNWEEYDNGPYGSTLGDVSSTGPLFRTFFPSTSPNRTIPQWSSIFNSSPNNPNNDVREYLPFESRNLNFRFVVRDNHPGAGGASYSSLAMKVNDQSGPFKITFPNATSDRLFKNACNKIKWDVANTFNLPVNCKKVDILLIRNRETNNPIILKTNTDNDGVELVDIPDLGTNVRVRVCVRAADHIFFDISDRDITIVDATTIGVNMGVVPNVLNVCLPQLAQVKIKSCSFGNYSGKLKLFIEAGLPQGTTYSFGKTELSESDETDLSIDANNLLTKSNFTITVAAITSQGDTLRDELTINAIKNDFSDQQLIYPKNGERNIIETPVFHWLKSINASIYAIEIATSPSFGSTIIFSQKNISNDTLLLPVLLKENKIYYWRIIPSNDCGQGSISPIYAFQTVNKVCVEQAYTGNPIGLFTNRTHSIQIPINFNGQISDINFNNVEINADAVQDVILSLISPKGTKVKLFNKNCGVTVDFNCSFDDQAPIPIDCPPLFNKRMRPYEALSAFNGENLQGNWVLEVVTSNLFRDGTVRNFTFQYCAELKLNNPQSINNGPLRMNIGESKNITNSLLLAQDVDNGPSELLFTLVAIPHSGELLLNGAPLTYGSTFSQKDIDDSRLSYKHTGNTPIIDGFLYTVNDGQGGWFGISQFDIFVGPVATLDKELAKNFILFPNPAQDNLIISLKDLMEKEAFVSISDMNGKEISRINMADKSSYVENLSTYESGIYLVSLTTKSTSITKKLIVKR